MDSFINLWGIIFMDCKQNQFWAIYSYYFRVDKHFWKQKNHLIIKVEQLDIKQNQHYKFVLSQKNMNSLKKE